MNRNGLPYRQGTHAIIIDKNNNFLLIQKCSYDTCQWDFPGGGLDEGEDPAVGVLRELEEELGSTDFKIIKQSPIKYIYEWPQDVMERGFAKNGIWQRGQEKHLFLVRFVGNKEDLVLQEAELKDIKWVPYSKLKEHMVFDGQWEKLNKAIEEAGLASA